MTNYASDRRAEETEGSFENEWCNVIVEFEFEVAQKYKKEKVRFVVPHMEKNHALP